MMKRFLTLNDLLHEQALAEMDSQSDWRCHKKTPAAASVLHHL